MGFKGLVIALVILLTIYGVFVGSAETLSEKLEAYSLEKMEEPKIQDFYFYNINYTYLTAKYQRTLKLLETFLERYGEDTERMSDIIFLKARTYDRMGDYGTAMNYYKEYQAKWPDGKKKSAVKERIEHKLLL